LILNFSSPAKFCINTIALRSLNSPEGSTEIVDINRPVYSGDDLDKNCRHLPEYVIDNVSRIAAESIVSQINDLSILRL
jgi:hypothetical protein